MKPKLQNSEAWLKQRYLAEKKTPAQIAREAGCSESTIWRRLRELGLVK